MGFKFVKVGIRLRLGLELMRVRVKIRGAGVNDCARIFDNYLTFIPIFSLTCSNLGEYNRFWVSRGGRRIGLGVGLGLIFGIGFGLGLDSD